MRSGGMTIGADWVALREFLPDHVKANLEPMTARDVRHVEQLRATRVVALHYIVWIHDAAVATRYIFERANPRPRYLRPLRLCSSDLYEVPVLVLAMIVFHVFRHAGDASRKHRSSIFSYAELSHMKILATADAHPLHCHSIANIFRGSSMVERCRAACGSADMQGQYLPSEPPQLLCALRSVVSSQSSGDWKVPVRLRQGAPKVRDRPITPRCSTTVTIGAHDIALIYLRLNARQA